MRFKLLVLERWFRNIRLRLGELLQAGRISDYAALTEMQLLCGQIEQTLVRCQVMLRDIDRLRR